MFCTEQLSVRCVPAASCSAHLANNIVFLVYMEFCLKYTPYRYMYYRVHCVQYQCVKSDARLTSGNIEKEVSTLHAHFLLTENK